MSHPYLPVVQLLEGSRYNALHVAAKARNGEICDLVLQTVSNVAFIQLLYGDDDTAGCQDRARILLDLYLNTPDKALNETPLHFAVKFGALAVADILVSYPQCDKHARNKFGQTPKDISPQPIFTTTGDRSNEVKMESVGGMMETGVPRQKPSGMSALSTTNSIMT
ncbi:hypothetical protein ANN_03662 [Periplaneta americana]|uniref:Uncharacterized protein n=1 Tax=Periplaneta americana TaxID=6978 RepID=A0ABQ8TZG9_PERAM|nr:hypothetical protein ANN_03662 [Periplaneta americana]